VCYYDSIHVLKRRKAIANSGNGLVPAFNTVCNWSFKQLDSRTDINELPQDQRDTMDGLMGREVPNAA
jgi:hypothetical protein